MTHALHHIVTNRLKCLHEALGIKKICFWREGKMLNCLLRPLPLRETLQGSVTKHQNDATLAGWKRNETQEKNTLTHTYRFCYGR